MATVIVWIIAVATTAYLLAAAAYLWLLVLAAAAYRPLVVTAPPRRQFTLLIPAHDEAVGIGVTLASVAGLSYPAALLRVVVIADNCTDATATVARNAGFEVLERDQPDQPGKGAALSWALDSIGVPAGDGAVAVLDADCLASPEWLLRAHAYLDAGAAAVQASYGVSNQGESWGARLAEVALTVFNHVRPAGRSRLGMSAGLSGSGMVLTGDLLRRLPWRGAGVTEDLDYACHLAGSGVAVAFDADTRVAGQAGSGRAARTQHARWEGGRFTACRQWVPRLLRSGSDGGRVALGAMVDLLVLPLGLLVLLGVSSAGLAAAVTLAFGGSWLPAILPAISLALVVASVPAGLAAVGAEARLYRALLLAPVYVAWKVPLYARLLVTRRRQTWVRTSRRGVALPGKDLLP